MKRIFALSLISLMAFALSLSREGYWNSVKIIEKEIFDKNNIYSISKDDLSKLCEKKSRKVKNAFMQISPYFDKSEKIIFSIKDPFQSDFFNPEIEQISPFDKTQFKYWIQRENRFFVQIYSIFKNEKNLSALEIACPSLKMEFFREPEGKNLRCALFPYGYSYRCGAMEGVILFAPSLGYCFTQKECEKCLKSARLEFFGSQEYLIGLSAIRPLRHSENYICFRFDEKGNIL
ncbi:MAG: hypothetical protein ACE14Q_01335 [Acidobacteriota bacterium]